MPCRSCAKGAEIFNRPYLAEFSKGIESLLNAHTWHKGCECHRHLKMRI